MTDSLRFLWIDDDKSRETSAENLGAKTGAVVQFQNVARKDLADQIRPLIQNLQSDLILIDHMLDKTTGVLRESHATGATVSELIKESYPHLPIVCVTKVDIDRISFPQRLVYDHVLSSAHLTRQGQLLVVLAKGFKQITDKAPQNENELLDFLDCPPSDRIRLMHVLPYEIKTGFARKDYASVLWRWLHDVLFYRPGFLYDSLWAATLTGAKENSFLLAQEKLRDARYSGIFANDIYPRWWASRILEILYANRGVPGTDDPRLLGRAYLGIPTQGYSKCGVSNKDLPDTVAYADASNQKRMQACLQFTKQHPAFQRLLFFEELRLIKEVHEQ